MSSHTLKYQLCPVFLNRFTLTLLLSLPLSLFINSGADQSRRTQQVSPPLTAHNTSSGNMLSDNSLTTNDKSMLYPTTTTTNNNTNSGAHANASASNNPVAAPLASIHEHSKSHAQSPAKPQLTATVPSNGSPPKHSNNNTFKSEHPWLSRDERGMQSKSDYSKTTLDSHEPRDRFDSDDFNNNNNNNAAPYSPERAEAKNKTVSNTITTAQEHKNSAHKLPTPATSSSNTNTATAAIFSPVKTVTRSGSEEGEEDDDFGVGGDLWDDSMEMTPSITTGAKGLYATSTSAKLSPDKRPHPIVIGSPQKPAQKALQEFLESNTIDDRELQEELLNQVEIEKRIQENNRSKQALQSNNNINSSSSVQKNYTNTSSSHHSTQQQQQHSTRTNQNTAMLKNTAYTPMNTPMNTTNVTNASTLQHELTHQHEIEHSIREQMKNKQHNSSHITNNNHSYNNSVYSNTNTKTHYSKTTNSKVNTHINSTAKSPILEDIRNFQYSFDSNEQMVYNTDIMHSQSYDNAQVRVVFVQ